MRRVFVSLVTLLAFACATVRVPVAAPDEPAEPAGEIAEPMLDLWLESPDAVSPHDQAQAEQTARAALESALKGRRLLPAPPGSEPVLFVRERAVGLTDARRTQQTWAKVGIVVGIVAVVAVVVIAIVAGTKSGAKAAGPHVAAPATHASAGVAAGPLVTPRARPPSPSPPPPVTAGVGHAVHQPHPYGPAYGPGVPFTFWFQFWIPPRPVVLMPEDPGDEPPPYFAPDEPVSPLVEGDEPPGPPLAAEEPEPPPPPPELRLPPLSPTADFPVGERSFFAGPRTALQVDLLDRATGRVVWTHAVANDVDPRDAAAVARLMDDALAGQEWAR